MAIRRRKSAFGAVLALGAIGAAVVAGRVSRLEIVEDSMRPALEPGDYVVAIRAGTHRRGQVVLYEAPGRPGFELVKRVVALAGDHVEISGGQLHINRQTIPEPWADGPTYPDGEWQLAAGELFVLGDVRSRSSGDSRQIGPVATRAASLRVIWRYWPLRRIGRV